MGKAYLLLINFSSMLIKYDDDGRFFAIVDFDSRFVLKIVLETWHK